MKKVNIGRRAVRKAVIQRLKDCGLHSPGDAKSRKFINELLDIPLNAQVLDTVTGVSENESIPSNRQDVINRLYYSNAAAGMVIVRGGKSVSSFLSNVRRRFERGGAVSG